jgi:hypothetical protein
MDIDCLIEIFKFLFYTYIINHLLNSISKIITLKITKQKYQFTHILTCLSFPPVATFSPSELQSNA